MQTNGWLFDIYPLGDRLVLWFITEAGARLRLETISPIASIWAGRGRAGRYRPGSAQPGLGAPRLSGPGPRPLDRRESPGFGPGVRSLMACFLDSGIWLGAAARGRGMLQLRPGRGHLLPLRPPLFPCAWYRLEARDGRLAALRLLRRPLPRSSPRRRFTTLTLGLTRDPPHPPGVWQRPGLGLGGRDPGIGSHRYPRAAQELACWLQRADPDLVLSDWGDEEIVPTLTRWSRETGVRLPLDRETGPVAPPVCRGPQLFLLWPHRLPGLRRAPFTAVGTWTGAIPFTIERPAWRASCRSAASARCRCSGRPGPPPDPDHLHATGPGHGRRHPHPLAQG